MLARVTASVMSVCFAFAPCQLLSKDSHDGQVPQSVGAGMCLAIPDGVYNGSLESMTCRDIAVTGNGATITDLNVHLAVDHGAAGDLVFKLLDPSGSRVVTLLSRPDLQESADDGSGCCGVDTDLSNSFPLHFDDQSEGPSSEQLGPDLGTACADDGVCSYQPFSGAASPGGLGLFNGLALSDGIWKMCVGDASLGDVGQLCDASLDISVGPIVPITAQITTAQAFTDCLTTIVDATVSSDAAVGDDAAEIVVVGGGDGSRELYRQSLSVPAGMSQQALALQFQNEMPGISVSDISLRLFASNGEPLTSGTDITVAQADQCGLSSPVIALNAPSVLPPNTPFTVSWNSLNVSGELPCTSTFGDGTSWPNTPMRPGSGSENFVSGLFGFVKLGLRCENSLGLRNEKSILVETARGGGGIILLGGNRALRFSFGGPEFSAAGSTITLSWDDSSLSTLQNVCVPKAGAGTDWSLAGPLDSSGSREVVLPQAAGPVEFGIRCSFDSRTTTARSFVVQIPETEPKLFDIPLPIPVPQNANCPAGFFTALVDDGPLPGVSPGIFGLELLLDPPGSRRLAGGLNFGGLIDVSQRGFAAVNIANSAGENQLLNVSLTGSPRPGLGNSLPVRLNISRQVGRFRTTVFDQITQLTLDQAFTTTLSVPPGFYVAGVAVEGLPASEAGGAPEGRFLFSLTTSFVGRPGGSFQGGAVVGGYHGENPFGSSSGFASFCLASPNRISVDTFGASTYGPSGAADLRLRLRDVNRDVYVEPSR
jgi:hypothetical protein